MEAAIEEDLVVVSCPVRIAHQAVQPAIISIHNDKTTPTQVSSGLRHDMTYHIMA